MSARQNVLFIMFDQLRFDYLSCAGHPHLHTPHIDSIAERGVRFTQCYVQSPVCGAARMSCYTGRYVHSHGAAWNGFPLKVGEMTMGDHLRPLGMDTWLIGKTHMRVDHAGFDRLGISRDSIIGARIAECGFDIFTRDDGLWGQGPDGDYDPGPSAYNQYLHSRGYEGDNPWHDFANAGVDDNGMLASGYFMKNAGKPANIIESDSETPWLTTTAMAFLDSQRTANNPWLCHLSYIKPHWPYIVPAPYHNLYTADHLLPVNRAESERMHPHPVYEQFMNNVIGQAFRRDEVRNTVLPAYMGLIKQCDDQMGRLFAHLKATGQDKNTMIVITSDHGDYMGDHWLGEKDLFHEPSVKVPLLIFDPSADADATRGTVCDALVENIDLLATFIDHAGGEPQGHIVEGKSLMPFLHGETPDNWREFAVSEYDYSLTPIRERLNLTPADARLFMIADERYTFMHAEGGFRPMLFDRLNDPNELDDLGKTTGAESTITLMYERLSSWARRQSQRTTFSDTDIIDKTGRSRRRGIVLGVYDDDDIDPALMSRYKGVVPQRP